MMESPDAVQIRDKMEWSGTVTAVQPRIRLTRSFDQSSHTYLGYLLRIAGTLGGEGQRHAVDPALDKWLEPF